MSIPVRFDWYDKDGKLLAANRGCFTVSYSDKRGDLNLLSLRLQEIGIELHQKYIHADVRYAVPHSAVDYMFDLFDPKAIIPNKFKDKNEKTINTV
jgi:hypothetical protein